MGGAAGKLEHEESELEPEPENKQPLLPSQESSSSSGVFRPHAGSTALRIQHPSSIPALEDSIFPGWREPPAHELMVRGPRQQSIPSPSTLYDCARVDVFQSKQRYPNMAKRVQLPRTKYKDEEEKEEEGGSGEKTWKSPDIFVVSLSIPTDPPNLIESKNDGRGYTVCVYFTMRQDTRDILRRVTQENYDPQADNAANDAEHNNNNNDNHDLRKNPKWNAVKLFEQWCRKAPTDRDFFSRFKLIPSAQNWKEIGMSSWLTPYNGKPVSIKRSGQTGFLYHHPETSCLEFEISLHAFPFLTKRATHFMEEEYFENLIATFGFVLEGRTPDELPECLIGLAQVCYPDPEHTLHGEDVFRGETPCLCFPNGEEDTSGDSRGTNPGFSIPAVTRVHKRIDELKGKLGDLRHSIASGGNYSDGRRSLRRAISDSVLGLPGVSGLSKRVGGKQGKPDDRMNTDGKEDSEKKQLLDQVKEEDDEEVEEEEEEVKLKEKGDQELKEEEEEEEGNVIAEIKSPSLPPPSDFKPKAGSTTIAVEDPSVIPKFNDHKYVGWLEPPASDLKVRSKSYLSNKKKIPSPGTLYDCVGVDVLQSDQRYPDMASRVVLPTAPFSDGNTKTWISPDIFIVSISIPTSRPKLMDPTEDGPGHTICMYFTMRQETLDILRRVTAENYDPSSEQAPEGDDDGQQQSKVNAVRLFEEWCRRAPSDAEFFPRFKLVPMANNWQDIGLPGWMARYNGKPVLIKRQGKTGFIYQHPDLSCIEFDISLHPFPFVAKQAMSFLKENIFKKIVAVFGFVIEGRSNDELPECLIGLAQISNSDPAHTLRGEDVFRGEAPETHA